eukprot:14799990-Ditylum_brightwellii.AAC.1
MCSYVQNLGKAHVWPDLKYLCNGCRAARANKSNLHQDAAALDAMLHPPPQSFIARLVLLT